MRKILTKQEGTAQEKKTRKNFLYLIGIFLPYTAAQCDKSEERREKEIVEGSRNVNGRISSLWSNFISHQKLHLDKEEKGRKLRDF